jgi:hypothetical protein
MVPRGVALVTVVRLRAGFAVDGRHRVHEGAGVERQGSRASRVIRRVDGGTLSFRVVDTTVT